eukprot:TRINITY_DN13430_c0_g1_i1.p1 TRINITY_DN13430_c0_g1~~TRINITY_DN13430_c0_g1_i1.p1  ORF type:complete len:875 (+),score=233.21 TRINITY_DN13430_c0_g1_i1:35-2659(+)
MASKENKDKEKKAKTEEEDTEEAAVDLSEEDQKVKDEVDELVGKIQEAKEDIAQVALEKVRDLVKSATGTVTSIPKPLKFLAPHYDALKANFAAKPPTFKARALMADILSLLAMIKTDDDATECLTFKLQGDITELAQWGHEYIRHISGEIGHVFADRKKQSAPADDLMRLVDQIVPFYLKHNSESQAIDLLTDVDRLGQIVDYCSEDLHDRVVLYLHSQAQYVSNAERTEILRTTFALSAKFNKYSQALRSALLLVDDGLVQQVFDSCEDPLIKKQLGFQLARHRVLIDFTGDNDLDEIISNTKLSEYFLYTARDHNAMAPKTPDDVYKTNVQDQRTPAANISSHTQNLASTFVNAFANAGFCSDKLMTTEGNEWLHKNKEHRMISAAASLGLIMLWDVDSGLAQVDKYLYSNEEYIRAGALMAIGILHNGVRNDCDPALALLQDYLGANKTKDERIAAIMGLGLAYSGSKREDISELLLPLAADDDTPLDLCAFAALSLGLVFVGTCDENICEVLTTALMARGEKQEQLNDSLLRFLGLALGLLFLGRQDNVEAALLAVQTLPEKIAKYCEVTVKTCAHAGSGGIESVKELMKLLVEKYEKEEDALHQSAAVLGIGLVAMGEELGADMCKRTFEHILQYGDTVMRRAIPLALALVSVSNPQLVVMDTLGKLSHDPDMETSMVAVLALGIVGAGTNNSRIANMLRQLANYYAKEANHLFLVRVAQGLLHLGKGLLTMSPFHSDLKLMNRPAVSGLLIVLHACLDTKGLLMGKYHFLLYYLVTAIAPRMFVTVDEQLHPLPVPCRVGSAVDTVAIPGRPKTITGFQTHNTPVLLQSSDRAEIATDKYTIHAAVLEDVVIVVPKADLTLTSSMSM